MPMTLRTKISKLTQGKSRLEGYDFGKWPKHKFQCLSNKPADYPVMPVTCGYDEWRKECFRARTFSDTFAIEYVQSGVFIIQQNNITRRVMPGEIFLVHLDSNNSMRCETEFATKRVITVDGSLLREIIEKLNLDKINILHAQEAQRFITYFDQLDALAAENTPDSWLQASTLCYSLLLELAKTAVVSHRPTELQQALEYIHNHLDCHITLEELARNSNTSMTTLHRQFRQFLNVSPIKYFIDCKLERAKLLLTNHSYSIKEIAELLSYSSPQFFAKEFKKKYGVSPKSIKIRKK